IKGIQYLVQQGIIQIPQTNGVTSSSSQQIPQWVKNNAGWWSAGQISDDDFVKAIQYMINSGIITVS
ncbi:MAG: peptidase, partial [Nitrosotalea sp.]